MNGWLLTKLPGKGERTMEAKEAVKDEVKEEVKEDGPTKGGATNVLKEVCPYLDTVNRAVLDFDFEKACCVTGHNFNIYACLVCGRYYQGRSCGTKAYLHSLEEDHHVFLNLQTGLFYCLPDNYEVVDASLGDILRLLDPPFAEETIAKLDTEAHFVRGIDGGDYLPGVVGLTGGLSALNAVIQSLVRIPPLRNFFLRPANYAKRRSALVQQFGLLTRKIWSRHLFRPHVSPHELLQTVSRTSSGRFAVGRSTDALDLLAWMLNELHRGLGGTQAKGSSVVHRIFQGDVFVRHHVRLRKRKAKASDADRLEPGAAGPQPEEDAAPAADEPEGWRVEEKTMPFFFLAVDVPPMPLFRDAVDANAIPQVPLAECLAKYGGEAFQELMNGDRRQFRVRRPAPYLIIHINRFFKNTQQVLEKNFTVVNCPVRGLDLSPYVDPAFAKGGLVYDLVSSIVHEGKPDTGTYKTLVHFAANGTWYEMHDLGVRQIHAQVIGVSESYVQIYRRRQDT